MISLPELLVRFIAGGTLVVIISILGKSHHPQLAGLAVLFPVVSVVGYYFLISAIGKDAAKPIILFSIYSLPTVLAFLVVLRLTIHRTGLFLGFASAILAWLIVSAVMLFLEKQYFHIFIR